MGKSILYFVCCFIVPPSCYRRRRWLRRFVMALSKWESQNPLREALYKYAI